MGTPRELDTTQQHHEGDHLRPFVYDEVVPEYELLAKGATKGANGAGQAPSSAKLAAMNAAVHAKEAIVAGKEEKDEEAAEKKFHDEAVESGKQVRADEAAAAKANQEEAAQMAKDAASATKSIMAANAATTAAEADNEAKQKEYKDLEAKIEHEQGAADSAAAARKAKIAGEIADNDAEIKKTKQEAADAEEAAAVAHSAHEKHLEDISDEYHSEAEAIKTKRDADEKAFTAEEAAIKSKYNGEASTNMEKWELEKATLALEKKHDEEAAATEQANIESRAAKIKADHDAADAAWHHEEDLEAQARHASRAKTQAAFAAKAEAEEDAYQATMGEIAQQKAAADHSQHEWEADMDASEEEQKDMDAESKADEAADAEIAECATDGTECQEEGGECKNLKDEGLFMACDGYSCATADPGDCYHNWAHIPDALPMTPLKPVTAKCLALRKKIPGAFAAMIKKFPFEHPLTVIGCADADRASKKKALDAFLDSAEECPPFCMPGSQTTTGPGDTAHGMQGGAQDTNGLCVPEGAMAQVKQNLDDIPVYQNTGTNGRFDAGISTKMCDFANKLVNGWMAGLKDKSEEDPKPIVCVNVMCPAVMCLGKTIPGKMKEGCPGPQTCPTCDEAGFQKPMMLWPVSSPAMGRPIAVPQGKPVTCVSLMCIAPMCKGKTIPGVMKEGCPSPQSCPQCDEEGYAPEEPCSGCGQASHPPLKFAKLAKKN